MRKVKGATAGSRPAAENDIVHLTNRIESPEYGSMYLQDNNHSLG